MEGTPRSNLGRAHATPGIISDGGVPPLGESVLHVWILGLKLDRESLALQEEMLSAEEWKRVRRYSSQSVGRRFIVRRGLLRQILGQYLDYPPERIRFVYNAHGKPFLAPEHSSDLQFSLSDSGDMAALAVGIREPVGIDVEILRTVRLDGEPPPPGSLQPEEACPESLGWTEHSSKFFHDWTRREALAKAEGVGLQMLSGQSGSDGGEDCAPSGPGASAALDERGFHIHALTLPTGYVGALAARPKSLKIVYCSA